MMRPSSPSNSRVLANASRCFLERGELSNLICGVLIKARILNCYGSLVCEQLEDRQIAVVERAALIALDVENSDDLILGL